MKPSEVVLFLVLGVVIWGAGTVYFARRGRVVLESTPARYWAAFVITPVASVALCLAILEWRHVSPANWSIAALLLVIPGMVGEALMLSQFRTFMPRLQATSSGKLGAFLFASYALVLAVAEWVSLGAGK